MKKILIILSVVMLMFMVSCSNNNYYERMKVLDPPVQMSINGDFVWITHERELNENEILYYAPESLKIDGNIYLNESSNYYIYTIKPSIFQWSQYRIVTSDELKQIFD